MMADCSSDLHRFMQIHLSYDLNVSTTPITAMGCRQCLPLNVVQMKGKHCRTSHCRNGIVDTFGHDLSDE